MAKKACTLFVIEFITLLCLFIFAPVYSEDAVNMGEDVDLVTTETVDSELPKQAEENQLSRDNQPASTSELPVDVTGHEQSADEKEEFDQRELTSNKDVDSSEAEISSESDDKTAENESSLFSLERLIRSVFDPVIQEFQTDTKDMTTGEDNPVITISAEIPQLQLESLSSVENATTPDESEAEQNQSSTTNNAKTNNKLRFQCTGKNVTVNDTATVKLVNGTELLHRLSFKKNESVSECVLVMFYAPWCTFSAQTAPHYNALGRAFPNLDILAVDAVHFSNLNARFGTVSVPNILLFHQSRAVVKYNQSLRTFENFVIFVMNITGLEPNMSITLDERDYLGPLSNIPTVESDYLLWLAWVFVVVCTAYMVTVSSTGQHIINRVNILWQEHQHIE